MELGYNMNLSSTVGEVFGLKIPKLGTIGLELECEGKVTVKFGKPSKYWNIIPDASLHEGTEYVLIEPINDTEIDPALDEWKSLTKNCKFVQSIRTSNHVHFNCFFRTMEQMYAFLCFYWFVENILVKANGKSREGNLFCLRIKDAETMFSAVIHGIRTGQHLIPVATDEYRYAACNLAALRKYGSVELRFMKGYVNPSEISFWVKELYRGFNKAISMKPHEILELYRKNTNSKFLSTFFSDPFIEYLISHCKGDWASLINENFPFVNELVNKLKITQLYERPLITHSEDLDPDPEVIEELKRQRMRFKISPKPPTEWSLDPSDIPDFSDDFVPEDEFEETIEPLVPDDFVMPSPGTPISITITGTN